MYRSPPDKDLLLCAMPFNNYAVPSLQIACLKSYLKEKGFDVDARHLHLEIATEMMDDKEAYNAVCEDYAEEVGAALLYDSARDNAERILEKRLNGRGRVVIERIDLAMRSIFESIPWVRYPMVGFSCHICQLFPSVLYAKWIKERRPEVKIIFGGPAASGEMGMGLLRSYRWIDWCVDGEGEIALTELVKNMKASRIDPWRGVPGLIWRDSDGVVHTNARKQILKLDRLPIPDYDSYFEFMENHDVLKGSDISPYIMVESSRGCFYRCAFCNAGVYWDGRRSKACSKVSREIAEHSQRHKVLSFRFADLMSSPKHAERLYDGLASHNVDYSINMEIRADVDRDVLQGMSRAGVSIVLIGIESLSSSLLRKMGKGTRCIQNVWAMKRCEELGIVHDSNLIIGFPSESQPEVDEAVENMKSLHHLRPPFSIQEFNLICGSPCHKTPEKYGIRRVEGRAKISSLLPESESENFVGLIYEFERDHPRLSYDAFIAEHERWKADYKKTLANRVWLLRYRDGVSFLEIVDERHENMNHMVINGPDRDLYLYCDDIRSIADISRRFAKRKKREILTALTEMVDLKIMFREGDDYLSLALRDSLI